MADYRIPCSCGHEMNVFSGDAGFVLNCHQCGGELRVPSLTVLLGMPEDPQPPQPTQPSTHFSLSTLMKVPIFIAFAYSFGSLTRDASLRRQLANETWRCKRSLRQIGIALASYHDDYGRLPPPVTLGPDGKPWHSWRVLILPYLEEQTLYQRYKMDQPWDGPTNRMLGQGRVPFCLHCAMKPRWGTTANTDFCMVIGDRTIFGKEGTISPIWSWASKQPTLLVEIEDSDICWTEPRDLRWEELGSNTGPRVGRVHIERPIVLSGDGSVELLPKNTSVDVLTQMFAGSGRDTQ